MSPGRTRAWIIAARPATLPAAVSPVLVGTAVAIHARHFAAGPFVAALVAAVLIQIGTNLANDLFDFHKGADTAARLGPTRVTQSGLISPREVGRALFVTFGAAVVVGLYLVAVGGVPILLVGLASIASGVLYTGGPFPLGYHGLGDLFAFVFFGVVAVAGTYYVQALAISRVALAASIPVGLLVTAILVVNNVRDVDTDRLAGKRTLAVRLGRRATRAEYALCLVVAYALTPLPWLLGGARPLFFLPWLTAPLAYRLYRVVATREDGPALNGALKGTGRLGLLFSVLFALSLL
jgi:1,4-dihydroxy-2-naphthoate octaprenyltransferase